MVSTTLCALAKRRLEVVRLSAGRHHDHRHAGEGRIRREPLADLGGVPVGNEAVEQDEVGNGAGLAHQGQAGLVVGRGGNPITGLQKRDLDDL